MPLVLEIRIITTKTREEQKKKHKKIYQRNYCSHLPLSASVNTDLLRVYIWQYGPL